MRNNSEVILVAVKQGVVKSVFLALAYSVNGEVIFVSSLPEYNYILNVHYNRIRFEQAGSGALPNWL